MINYPTHNYNLENAYIFDMDGTISWANGRDWYDYSKVLEDIPNQPIINICKVLQKHADIIIVTARKAECLDDTKLWLNSKGIFSKKIYMKPNQSTLSDSEVKEEIYRNLIKPFYNVLGVFEDRLEVCRMWHNLGLPLLRVGDPDATY